MALRALSRSLEMMTNWPEERLSLGALNLTVTLSPVLLRVRPISRRLEALRPKMAEVACLEGMNLNTVGEDII